MWTAQRVRETFLRFFKERGHAIIPSASLIPENDPSVLFTTAGMHPLVPYLMGQEHPAGKRLANVQKCIRTGDIDEVGDATHLTFFEMLGNWSLGDYFKEEAIRWSFELLTGKPFSISHEIEKGQEVSMAGGGFGIDPKRLAVSVFAGDADAPRDEESVAIWKSLGIPEPRIAYLGKDDNWWPAGGKHPGPQGPDTEMFVWIGEGSAPDVFDPNDDRWVEVWNDVFMQFKREGEKSLVYQPLKQKNVDTGMGLERMLTVLTGTKTVYETDLFGVILRKIEELVGAPHPPKPPLPTGGGETKKRFLPLTSGGGAREGGAIERHRRVIADHLRAATFILGDPFGVSPSNVDQGYVARKLIRRAIRAGKHVGITRSELWTPDIAAMVIAHYGEAYPELRANASRIAFELREEEERFNEVLERGEKHLAKLIAALPTNTPAISGRDAFTLYESYGFPIEITEDLAREQGRTVDRASFDAAMREHQEQSRAAQGQRFQGGLADHSDQSIRYHTATHLTHQALRTVLGERVEQRGSNITSERMRFDFSHPEKVTAEQLRQVETLIQQQIDADLPVHYELMEVAEAKERGVIGLFEDAYAKLGGKVKVYFIGSPERGFFSKEICGGPHVAQTGMIGRFRIVKEETISRGVRRIKAVVEPPAGHVEIAEQQALG